jgi:hypothetical protein
LAEDSVSADNGEEPSNLEGVLDRLIEAAKRDHNGIISVGDVQDMIGRRSFGPMLLVPGLIGLSPIGAIPGIPGVMAAIELFFAWQIVIGRKNIWLPQFLTRRSMTTARFRRGVQALRPYARWVDKFLLRPRLTFLTRGPFFYLIASMCVFVSLITPVIELVPLAGIVPNAALTAFGLAVTAHDGLWALVALASTLASVYLIALAL